MGSGRVAGPGPGKAPGRRAGVRLAMAATISGFIKRDLINRLGANPSLAADLTLSALASHYRVSFTPVREALRDLVAEGVLLKQGNGRVEVNPAWGGPGHPGEDGPGPGALRRAEELEEALALEVIAKSLRGASDYLREEATAKRLGVGRTAIRQAFGRLAGRGLLVHVPRCGWRVRAFDEADLDAYLEVREVLELKALELARPHLVEADLRTMLAGNAPGGGDGPRLDNNLHRYLVEKAGNPYIRDVFARHGAYFTTLFDFAAPETHVVAEMARQHRAILRALIEQDWARAGRELSRHIRAQRPIVKQLMSRIGRAEPGPPPRE
jgi:DNA-binding GntR family transcriptional regulator